MQEPHRPETLSPPASGSRRPCAFPVLPCTSLRLPVRCVKTVALALTHQLPHPSDDRAILV